MKNTFILSLLLLISCGEKTPAKMRRTQLSQTGEVQLIVTGVSDIQKMKQDAIKLGLKAQGESILFLSGDAQKINQLEIPSNENFNYILDVEISIDRNEPFTPDIDALYLAKKDFGILEFWKTHPLADGRGVIAGVLDDGISPHQDGFKITSTGERKLLAKSSQSSSSTFPLIETDKGYEVLVDENLPVFGESKFDLDRNGVQESYKIEVHKNLQKICWLDQCKGSFKKTGDYFLAKDPSYSLMVEIDERLKTLTILQPEAGDDSHGEGVASVISGYRIGNLEGFNGVAPGSQLVDYDLSAMTGNMEEVEYTVSTFLKGFDWLGSQGAEVINISYSLFFASVETQQFMRDAFEDIIKKHNVVLVFSAGNNGPGLGSLNRRTIYPDSSLVTGAFVSKELDEKVWGVTGIPDEGRVIYYSSRGPGQGTGPSLIAPLSNLTNSSPDSGHRAFNGTSSASPALAGAATVLISAIKQEGLKVHAASVVQALRLSGKRLKEEPFIFQGNGLPQIPEALNIYRRIITGDIFENVVVSVIGDTSDEVPMRGLTLRISQGQIIETREISLKGSVSSLATGDRRINLLTPVKLKYSQGISGPSELWVSSGESSFTVDIDLNALLKTNVEAFGEITVVTPDNLVLATIPITVVKDVNVLTRPSLNVKLGAQEGKRFHLFVPEGVKAFKVQSDFVINPNGFVSLSVFDTHGIRFKRARPRNDMWVQVDRPGHYQIGISLDGGTPRGAEINFKVEPMELSIKNNFTLEANPTITIANGSRTPFFGIIKAKKINEIIKTHFITSEFKDLEFTSVLEKGNYKIAVSNLKTFDQSYPYYNCSSSYKNDQDQLILSGEANLKISAPTEVKIRCIPFEYGMKGGSSYRWLVQLLKLNDVKSVRLDLASLGRKDIKIEGITRGTYSLQVEDPLNAQNIISLGNLEVY